MIIAVWIASGLLALVNLFAGGMKIATHKSKLGERMGWVEDFGGPTIKVIGALEVLAAIGLIVPPLTGILPILAPLAASGLVILQIGAIITHIRRGEQKAIGVNIVILLLALFVALARFGVFGTL